MNDAHFLEKLEQAHLTRKQQDLLFSLITDVFQRAIDARSPKNRPPGKAGLKAEKGYYRLLYLEGDLQQKVSADVADLANPSCYEWDLLPVVIRQLKDIPELQREIRQGIEAAVEETIKCA